MNKQHIQKLDHDDKRVAQQMHLVFQRSYKIEADLIGVKEFPPLERTISKFQSSLTEFYGFWKNEVLAAAIEIDLKEDQLEICSLVVDPDFFRQGIAGQLLDFVQESFMPKTSVVETASANVPAIKLYKNKGFVLSEQWLTTFGIEKVKLVKNK